MVLIFNVWIHEGKPTRLRTNSQKWEKSEHGSQERREFQEEKVINGIK